VLDLDALAAALAAHGRVARVVIAGAEGSSPREVGAAMLVWADTAIDGGQSGTIGGGALEFVAVERARDWLTRCPLTPSLPHAGGGGRKTLSGAQSDGRDSPPPPRVGEGWGGGPARVDRIALGPSLGQCCGGAVTLWTEILDRLPPADHGVIARGPGAMPLAVTRLLAAARGQGQKPATCLLQGWLVEPVAAADRQVWVWGAGHVGRALVAVLAPLPGVRITWIDTGPDRFPANPPPGVTVLPAADPSVLADHAPQEAEHLVLTYSHALDLDLCHRLLARGFRSCGLIGSATKWARFRSRLSALGHAPDGIARIRCPIGDPGLGKHPQAIAIGVAAEFLRPALSRDRRQRA
jgi:xanthine dehydrogenase accessory factor